MKRTTTTFTVGDLDPVRYPAGKPRGPRLDRESVKWLTGLHVVRSEMPHLSGEDLAAHVERVMSGQPELPKRSDRHQRDGRQPQPQPARPHPQSMAVAA